MPKSVEHRGMQFACISIILFALFYGGDPASSVFSLTSYRGRTIESVRGHITSIADQVLPSDLIVNNRNNNNKPINDGDDDDDDEGTVMTSEAIETLFLALDAAHYAGMDTRIGKLKDAKVRDTLARRVVRALEFTVNKANKATFATERDGGPERVLQLVASLDRLGFDVKGGSLDSNKNRNGNNNRSLISLKLRDSIKEFVRARSVDASGFAHEVVLTAEEREAMVETLFKRGESEYDSKIADIRAGKPGPKIGTDEEEAAKKKTWASKERTRLEEEVVSRQASVSATYTVLSLLELLGGDLSPSVFLGVDRLAEVTAYPLKIKKYGAFPDRRGWLATVESTLQALEIASNWIPRSEAKKRAEYFEHIPMFMSLAQRIDGGSALIPSVFDTQAKSNPISAFRHHRGSTSGRGGREKMFVKVSLVVPTAQVLRIAALTDAESDPSVNTWKFANPWLTASYVSTVATAVTASGGVPIGHAEGDKSSASLEAARAVAIAYASSSAIRRDIDTPVWGRYMVINAAVLALVAAVWSATNADADKSASEHSHHPACAALSHVFVAIGSVYVAAMIETTESLAWVATLAAGDFFGVFAAGCSAVIAVRAAHLATGKKGQRFRDVLLVAGLMEGVLIVLSVVAAVVVVPVTFVELTGFYMLSAGSILAGALLAWLSSRYASAPGEGNMIARAGIVGWATTFAGVLGVFIGSGLGGYLLHIAVMRGQLFTLLIVVPTVVLTLLSRGAAWVMVSLTRKPPAAARKAVVLSRKKKNEEAAARTDSSENSNNNNKSDSDDKKTE